MDMEGAENVEMPQEIIKNPGKLMDLVKMLGAS